MTGTFTLIFYLSFPKIMLQIHSLICEIFGRMAGSHCLAERKAANQQSEHPPVALSA
jgi:hypothetical protein